MAARLRHIAMGSNDPKRIGQFYADALGIELLVNTDDLSVLTDGYINFVICRGEMFTPSSVRSPGFTGVHHIGFQVDSRAEIEARLVGLDSVKADGDVDDSSDEDMRGFEVKWLSPDGVIFDLSEEGWPVSVSDPAT